MSAIRWSVPATVVLMLAGGCAVLKSPEAEPPPTPPAEAQEPAPPAPDEIEPQPAPKEVAPVPAPAPAPAPAPEFKRLLDYFRGLKKLAGVELAREYDNARTAFARTRSDYDRLRLALLHALPDTAYSDESRALDLLEPLIKSQNSMLHDLAFLIHAFVYQQRRLEHSLQSVQQKLDALKALEKNLIERQRGGEKRK